MISSELYQGQSVTILERAGARDVDYDVFLMLHNRLKQLQKEASKAR